MRKYQNWRKRLRRMRVYIGVHRGRYYERQTWIENSAGTGWVKLPVKVPGNGTIYFTSIADLKFAMANNSAGTGFWPVTFR